MVDLWFQIELEGDPRPPPAPPGPELYEHRVQTGEMFVAEGAGQVVGFGGSIVRGDVRFLSDLFVRGDRRGTGVGRALFRRAMPTDHRAHLTLSSTDPRAQALYTRSGLVPLWPLFSLSVDAGRNPAPAHLGSEPGLEMMEADLDEGLAGLDAEVSGRSRPQDLEHLVRDGRGTGFLFRGDGATVGYGFVRRHDPSSVWHPDGATIGPVGASTAGDARRCVLALLAWAAGRAPVVSIAVPGLHPALAPLLEVGARITYVELFQATRDDVFDPRRYVPSGSDLL